MVSCFLLRNFMTHAANISGVALLARAKADAEVMT
jgi:hypothetical protein